LASKNNKEMDLKITKYTFMKIKTVLLIVFALCLSACGGSKSDNNKLSIDTLLAEESADLEISEESIAEIIESIPSPIEIASILEHNGIEFKEEFLNDLDNTQIYTTDMSKALGLGIYSADMGYINIYEKTYLTINYLSAIQRLADDIDIGQFFDFATIKRMASNSSKMDSLIYLTTVNFNNMDTYLRTKKRSNMSILMVTGTWLEGLYIALQNYMVQNNVETMEWIGHQKVIVDQLILGLSAYSNDEYFKNLVTDLNKLKDFYANITITYEYHEPEAMEVDGRLVIVDKSTSKSNITHEQIVEVAGLVKEVRNDLVSNY